MNCKIALGFVAALAFLAIVRSQSASGTSCPELLSKMKSNNCCNLPNTLPNDTMKECKLSAKNFNGNRPSRGSLLASIRSSNSIQCKMQCVFNKLGLYDNSTERVDTSAAKAAVIKYAPDEWKDAATTAGSICSTALDNFYAKMNSTSMPGLGFKPACKPCSFMYATCTTIELIANCPSPSKSSACTSIADSFKACAANITAFFGSPPRNIRS